MATVLFEVVHIYLRPNSTTALTCRSLGSFTQKLTNTMILDCLFNSYTADSVKKEHTNSSHYIYKI